MNWTTSIFCAFENVLERIISHQFQGWLLSNQLHQEGLCEKYWCQISNEMCMHNCIEAISTMYSSHTDRSGGSDRAKFLRVWNIYFSGGVGPQKNSLFPLQKFQEEIPKNHQKIPPKNQEDIKTNSGRNPKRVEKKSGRNTKKLGNPSQELFKSFESDNSVICKTLIPCTLYTRSQHTDFFSLSILQDFFSFVHSHHRYCNRNIEVRWWEIHSAALNKYGWPYLRNIAWGEGLCTKLQQIN